MITDEVPTDCAAFLAAVNAVLDGDAPASALAGDHPGGCPDCRGLLAAARLLRIAGPALRMPPPIQADLSRRLVRSARHAARPRWPVPALLAGVVLGLGLWASRPTPGGAELVKAPTVPTVPAPRVADQWATVASVARSAGERATPSVALLSPPAVRLPAVPPTPAEPTAAALATLGQAARAGAEPVAGPTRRAVGLFLRDLGLSPKPAS